MLPPEETHVSDLQYKDASRQLARGDNLADTKPEKATEWEKWISRELARECFCFGTNPSIFSKCLLRKW